MLFKFTRGLSYLFKSKEDRKFFHSISVLAGYPIRSISLFRLALTHRSFVDSAADRTKNSNERLEFLGDAILDAVIAEYLYKKFPGMDEGFLSKKRDFIVNGKTLAKFSAELGLLDLMQINPKVRFEAKNKQSKI